MPHHDGNRGALSREKYNMTEMCFEVLDTRFRRLHIPTARLDVLHIGCRWAEGPAYFPAGRYLVWSDIPNNRMLGYDECCGTVSVFRQPSNFSNSNTADRSGRLVTCEHGGRRVSRTEFDGTVTPSLTAIAASALTALTTLW
jgi:gluconolactonase